CRRFDRVPCSALCRSRGRRLRQSRHPPWMTAATVRRCCGCDDLPAPDPTFALCRPPPSCHLGWSACGCCGHDDCCGLDGSLTPTDRKSPRLNSSHVNI